MTECIDLCNNFITTSFNDLTKLIKKGDKSISFFNNKELNAMQVIISQCILTKNGKQMYLNYIYQYEYFIEMYKLKLLYDAIKCYDYIEQIVKILI